jgi:hypothetical protein
MKTLTYTIKLPVATDALGRWLEENGARIEIACMLGTYHVTVTKHHLLAYSDEAGKHAETWEISRYNKDMMVALEEALRAAGAIEEIAHAQVAP